MKSGKGKANLITLVTLILPNEKTLLSYLVNVERENKVMRLRPDVTVVLLR